MGTLCQQSQCADDFRHCRPWCCTPAQRPLTMLTRRTTFDERFKFSEAQWCAIDREIGKACIYHYPDMRELLEYVADDYCRNRCNHQPASKNARQWRRRA